MLAIGNGQDLDVVKLDTYAYLDNEIVAVKAINLMAGTVTVERGVLDTVPAPHLASARIWFADALEALVLVAETVRALAQDALRRVEQLGRHDARSF